MNVSGVLVTPLQRIKVKGGDVLHAMKHSDIGYCGFGESYFSLVAAGAVKAWKRHTKMTMNIVVPMGQVRFVFRHQNEDGVDHFQVVDLGEDSYVRLTVSPGIWFGFQGLRTPQNLILNIASISHDPNEVERLELSEINYNWECP
jgi:dTDP-4-dehydrorhamnose 3,5-epimerase